MYVNLKYLIGIFLFLSFSFSQIVEKTIEFNFGEHNALVITLNGADKKIVEDEWKLANKAIGKTDKKKGEYITTGVNLGGLSNPVDWYMQLDKKKGDVELQICVISDEEFLSSTNQSENFLIVSKFLNDFDYTVQKATVRHEFESEKKELGKLQKSLKKSKNSISDNSDLIDKHSKKIDKANKDIESNLKKQKELNSKISEQGLVVENLLMDGNVPNEGSAEYDTFNDENDNLNKSQKKLEKLVDDYNDLLKTIDKSNRKIEKAQKDIKSDSKESEKLNKKIKEQGELVESLRKKLESM